MDTKEAIEKLSRVITFDELQLTIVELDTLEASEIIELLQRGEKYEAIVKDLEDNYGFFGHHYSGSNSTDNINRVIQELKQRYFPKPSENFTEEVMEKIKKGGN